MVLLYNVVEYITLEMTETINMDHDKITYFAETDSRNKKIKFGIKAKDRLKHVYIIGKTGMGKSTCLENMAIQDIQSGNGIAFIDPHGGTAEKLLDYVPESRIKDVLYFAPFDLEYPVSFNVMEDIGVDKRHLVVNGLMATFEKIWVDAWSARMAYILTNSLLALLEYPGSTLLGVNRLLADKDFRKKVVDNVKDPSVRSFWVDEFAKYTERFAAEATPAIQNKVGQFTSNPLVRNIIGQSQSSFDLRKIMDEKKILIINLSKGKVGEGNANLLGSMLITKIYLAAMSRADATEQELAKLPNFYLYVDEFQSFANKSFADILSEARKYKLNLTIAHQYIEQMEEEVRDAVFGNVGTMIAFRVGAFDSEVLEKEFAPTFMATDLVNLGFAQIYLKLMIDGVSSQPFSATTLGPIARPAITFKHEVISSSREQFAHPRAKVEREILDWHDAGTVREIRPQSRVESPVRSIVDSRPSVQTSRPAETNNRPAERNSSNRDKDYHRPTQSPEISKVDENRRAFMEAAEILRSSEKKQPVISMTQNNTRSETVSLSNFRQEKDMTMQTGKKTPSKENISSLKDALAGVISKAKPVEEKKPEKPEEPKPQVQTQPVQPPKPAPIVEPKTVEKETVVNKTTNKGEIPEDVLRNMLKVDDAK